MSSEAPFFIVGAGRSGTTLLRLMLAGHPRLHIPAETWFIQPLVAQLPVDAELTAPQCDAALDIITGHPRWPDMAMPAALLREQARALDHPRLADIVTLVFAHCRTLSGKPRIGDKTPHYFAILPQLARMFPQARFIHLVRDGRDVAISWIDAGWNRYHERDFEWRAAIRHRESWRGTPLWDRVCEVPYEALVAQPEMTLHRICGFLGEPFEPSMLDWARRQHLVADRDRHLHRRLQEPLSAQSLQVWKQRLRGWECFAMEACLHRELEAAGYRLRFASPAWRPAQGFARAALRLASPLLRRGVPWLHRHGVLPRMYV